MINANEAKYILESHSSANKTGRVTLLASTGYVLAADVFAVCDVPAFNNAAMDGYAFKFISEKKSYTVTETIAAGAKGCKPIKEGEAVRIFTGAPVPENLDTVVEQEICSCSNNQLIINGPDVRPGLHIRKKGAQNHKGQLLLKRGTLVTESMIAYLASAGVKEVEIFSPPSVAIIVTGSELVSVNDQKDEYAIYDANGPALLASLQNLKITQTKLFQVADNPLQLSETIHKALADYDMLILTGGISVGDYDHVKEVLKQEGVQQLIYKIAQKPGKPFFAGNKKNKWVFALPGNPAAVLTCFRQYVHPVIQKMCGRANSFDNFEILALSSSYFKKMGFTFFLKAKIEKNSVRILNGQDSFDLSAYAEANAYVELSPEKENFVPGDPVKTYRI